MDNYRSRRKRFRYLLLHYMRSQKSGVRIFSFLGWSLGMPFRGFASGSVFRTGGSCASPKKPSPAEPLATRTDIYFLPPGSRLLTSF